VRRVGCFVVATAGAVKAGSDLKPGKNDRFLVFDWSETKARADSKSQNEPAFLCRNVSRCPPSPLHGHKPGTLPPEFPRDRNIRPISVAHAPQKADINHILERAIARPFC
jgi:hypothetical protein